MKKLLVSAIILVTATSALAHRNTNCRTRTNRYGERIETCRTVSHSHRHDNDYGDGFFDGMLASSLILLTTSDAADDDYNRDFLESEITFALAIAEEGNIELTSELQKLVDETREANEGKEISDEEILEAYIIEFSK
ncbi:hypothetical protein A9Q84_09865 [Halobacteriovorax marinus]|uniref:Lipoprotein n=1 Tax=Halobacteriovorax marinus TaxID=97084 RepID=A0A1Y5FAY9_9BACT|nr:hypothetical protein A9Q84_09865 [Halobacteriovorax marinus]